MSKTREGGFYWVMDRYGWIVSDWDLDMEWWRKPGNEQIFYDSDFLEIDERRIVREEDNTKLPDTCKYCGKPLPNDADERYYHQNHECPARNW